MKPAPRTALIVGGGVTGLSTAYHLARRGYGRVIVVDKDGLGAGSSRRAAGITTGLLWSETGVRARKISVQLFAELSKTLPGYHYHAEEGCLNLFTPEAWPARAALLPLYDRLGAPYAVLTAGEVRARWPALRVPDGFVGLHDPVGGYSEPPEYVRALAEAAVAAGVEIRVPVKVTGWIFDGARLAGAMTTAGEIRADVVVSAAYAWTGPLLQGLGLALPVKAFVHQRYVSAPLAAPLRFPAVNADPWGGYVRPAAGGRVLMGVETADRNEHRVTSADFRLAELAAPEGLRERAQADLASLLPALTGVRWEQEDVGLICFSMDGEPVVGPVSAVPGLFVGAAFHSGGFSYNPAVGWLLAEWVQEGRPSLDLTAFSPDRFVAAAAADYLATTVPQRQAVRRRH